MRGCIAFFLFILVVAPALCAFEALAASSSWLLNRTFYTDILAAPDVYGALLGGMLSEAGGSVDQLRASGEYDEIIATLNTSEWRDAMSNVVDQGFDLIEGRSDTITFSIPLAPLKALLNSSVGEQFIRNYAGNLRTCAPGQEPFEEPANITGLPLPICISDTETRENAVNRLLEQLPQITANMPNRLTYTSESLNVDGISDMRLGDLEGALSTGVVAMGVFALGAWFVTGLIGFSRLKGMLMWWGATLVLPSIFILLIGILIATALMAPGTTTVEIGVDDNVTRAITDAVLAGFGKANTSILLAGGIPVLIGTVLFLLGVVLPARRREDPMLDLRNNPTTNFGGQSAQYNPFETKPKNDNRPKNDDPVIKF